ncbi:hypothetical protein NEOLI_005426 [Neolecta irregularis DAH-3]|uniref:Uncharacterized protein n=1 Tax=Neolecta irregularis (strain DAH-3) TaxID=1198029 RepID=A0A1U7LI47_NEOID|nr:hypothetical protein NEOLI_005426 [Neolecta irregularis DAH-3]|eukprot:OLL22222.1 hypothetical protein NEOLI_005426 [Neolecta irregularis DAH-3]
MAGQNYPSTFFRN